MGFDAAVAILRSWSGAPVVIHLGPDGSVMRGRLSELDRDDTDSAMFALEGDQLTGVAVALFRDAVRSATRQGDELVVQQGRVTVTVTRSAPTHRPTCGGRRSARD